MIKHVSSIFSSNFSGLINESAGHQQPLILHIRPGHEEQVLPLNVYDSASGNISQFPQRSQTIYPLDIACLGEALIHPGGHISTCETLLLETLAAPHLCSNIDANDTHSYPFSELVIESKRSDFLKMPEIVLPKKCYSYAWVYSPLSYNFGHWHGETLSALAALSFVHNQPKIVFPRLCEWQRQCLHLCGIDQSSYYELPSHCSVRVPNLIIPSASWIYKRDNYKAPLDYMKLIHRIKRISLEGESKSSETYDRIYLSRRSTAARSISNEEDVEKQFEKRGFRVLILENIDYSEGVRIFAKANVIAGPSGSALTRALFAKESCKFIQISVDKGWHPAYHFNASMAGVRKSYAYAEDQSNIKYRDNANPHIAIANRIESWAVNLESLSLFLDQVL